MSIDDTAAGGRESMDFDVVIVGAGVAGLSAAIRIKQRSPDLSVVVLEKGGEVGAHIVSGAVVDPIGIDALLPGWRQEQDHPFRTPVTEDRFVFLTGKRAWAFPPILLKLMPPLMNNHGNFIVSLAAVCRWLGQRAEALGVEIFPGFAASELLHDANGAVVGVATGDNGLQRDGSPGPAYSRGMALMAKYVLLAEGARGSLSKQAIARFGLSAGRDPGKYGIGIKEVWEVAPDKHRKGLVQHSFGWPLDNKTGGGSFLYHMEGNLVSLGMVVHLNYRNPYLSPFQELQRLKTHPAIASLLADGKRLSYGARALTEGGWQSVPKLVFPGGALIGCAAGFMNVPRIKGSHNAVLSGIEAADAVVGAVAEGRRHDELTAYEQGWRRGPIGSDLYPVRNVKPLWSRLGTIAGMAVAGLEMWATTLFRGWSPLGTLGHGKPDHACLEPASRHIPIDYPKPDGILTFDRLSSVFLSNTNHTENQPVHLRVADPELQRTSEHDVFAGPSTRYCPAGVYEWIEDAGGPGSRSTRRTAFTAKPATSRTPTRTSPGSPHRVGKAPSMSICDGIFAIS